MTGDRAGPLDRSLPALLLSGAFLLLAGCGGGDGPPATDGSAEEAHIAEPAPEYEAMDLEGNPVRLADLRGEVVLLNVWATWCAPCRIEMPDLQTLHDELEGEGFRVVGVSIDGPRSADRIEGFLDQLGVTFPILHDPDDRISGLLDGHVVPLTVLIDREGMMQWRHLGAVTSDDPGLRAAIAAAL